MNDRKNPNSFYFKNSNSLHFKNSDSFNSNNLTILDITPTEILNDSNMCTPVKPFPFNSTPPSPIPFSADNFPINSLSTLQLSPIDLNSPKQIENTEKTYLDRY